jgi:hypothetical protein
MLTSPLESWMAAQRMTAFPGGGDFEHKQPSSFFFLRMKKWTNLPLGMGLRLTDHFGFFPPDWPFGFQKSMTSLVQDLLTDPKDVFLFIMCFLLAVLHVPACLYLTASVSQPCLSRPPKDKSVVGFPLLAIN